MRVTISGGLGFIGSFLAEAYRDRGDSVCVIDNYAANVVHTIPGVDVRREDIRHAKLPPTDLVVHCASPVGSVGILHQAGQIADEIVGGTTALAKRCASREIPLVNISSSEVYGFSGAYHENDTLQVPPKRNARLEYGVGKIAAEFAVANTPNLRSLHIRPFNVAGPRQTRAKGFALPTFVEQALAGEPITVFGDGTQERSFTAVYDLTDFILNLKDEAFDGSTVNVGNPENRIRIIDLAQRVRFLLDSDSPIIFTDGKAVHGEQYEEAEGHTKVPVISRALAHGWTPKTSIDQLIELTAAESRQALAA